MTMQFLAEPPTTTPLSVAAKLMATHFASVVETLPTLEAQAFGTWVHGAYLAALLRVDDDSVCSTLLYKRIYSMISQGERVLKASNLSAIAETATRLFDACNLFSVRPQLRSSDLFAVAARLPLGPRTKQLVAWVDLAFGDAPNAYKNLTYFGVMADGCLYQDNMPVIETVDAALCTSALFQELPAFWRMLIIVSGIYTPYAGSADMVLSNIVAASALPRTTYAGEVSFQNYIAALKQVEWLFGPDSSTSRNTTLIYRLLQPWEGLPIKGSRYAEIWIGWMTRMTKSGDAILPNSVYRPALRRLVQRHLDPAIFASLEAIDPNAQPDDDEIDDTDDAADENPDEPGVDTDTEETGDEPDDSDTATPPETPDTATSDPTDPQLDQKNNSIGDISLEQDADPGQAYLYRLSVLSLNDTLTRDPNIAVSQDARQVLHLWCKSWLWMASMTQTQTLIKDLGLQKALEPVEEKD